MVLGTLVGKDDTWVLWAIIIVWATISIFLEQRYQWASTISGAIIALVGAMLLSNFKVIPTSAPVYDTVWDYIVPLSIPLLLFSSNILKIWKESRRLLFIFLIASIGTMIGTTVAFIILNHSVPYLSKIGAMMTGSYIGGGVNFAALSSKLKTPGEMVSSTVVADNSVMALYFLLLIAIPSIPFIKKHFKTHYHSDHTPAAQQSFWQPKKIQLLDIAFSIAAAIAIVAISFKLSELIQHVVPQSNLLLTILVSFFGDFYLLLTTLTLVIVAIWGDFFEKLAGASEIGTFLIYIFFVVIVTPASFVTIIKTAPLLFIFVMIILIFNLGLSLLLGKLLKFNIEEILLASNATAGGPTTAAALAIGKGWTDLVGPILIVGTLGYVIGNYAGTLMYQWLSYIA
ncbi:membrane protein [Staphylococcus cohnii subsp. cohnii]|nr:membrane protein [Staphylococcus cohnii subsp. cohnii]